MNKTCVRCSGQCNLEEHHIIEVLQGGSNEPSNKEWRCQACHKYEHVKRNLLYSIEYETQRGQVNRIECYQHRLEVLKALNTIELIRSRGSYLGYWTDNSTHYLPRRIPTPKEVKAQYTLNKLVEEAQVLA